MEGAPVSSLVSKLRVDVKVLIKIYACIINQTPEFCKGLLDDRVPKPVPVPDTGSRG